jgi:hypothetical protein
VPLGMPYVRDEEDPTVELLLVASDFARCGQEFPLVAASEFLGMLTAHGIPSSDAFVAAHYVREVGALYGEAANADAYLEAAYRLMGGNGATG